MDTSELLRTPLNVFLLTLVLVLAFLAAYRIKKKWLRLPVRIVFSIGAAPRSCSLLGSCSVAG